MLCVSHLVNLGAKKCMFPVRRQNYKIRAVLSYLCGSGKRRNVYQEVDIKLEQRVALPSLD